MGLQLFMDNYFFNKIKKIHISIYLIIETWQVRNGSNESNVILCDMFN